MAQRGSWASYVIWGCVAVCAVLASAFTIAVVVGAHRGIPIAGAPKRVAPPAAVERTVETAAIAPSAVQPRVDTTALEIARLNDALRLLAAERDRLAARLEHVERTLGDITASIKEPPVSPKPEPLPPAPTRVAAAPSQPTPSPAVMQAPRNPPAPDIGEPMNIFQPYSSVQPLINVPNPASAPMQIQAVAREQEPALPARSGSTATRTEFALDLGGDATMEGLRARWTDLQGSQGQALTGLRPLVSVQEGRQRGGVELRLIAGPFANAATAARTCAVLQTQGVSCQTAVFDGQRLAPR